MHKSTTLEIVSGSWHLSKTFPFLCSFRYRDRLGSQYLENADDIIE